jgi:hypothetical protein
MANLYGYSLAIYRFCPQFDASLLPSNAPAATSAPPSSPHTRRQALLRSARAVVELTRHWQDCKRSGSFLYDMFMGVELNPRYLQQPEVNPASSSPFSSSSSSTTTTSTTTSSSTSSSATNLSKHRLQVSGLQQSAELASSQVPPSTTKGVESDPISHLCCRRRACSPPVSTAFSKYFYLLFLRAIFSLSALPPTATGIHFTSNAPVQPLDAKLFHNGRPGIVAWTLVNVAFGTKMCALRGLRSRASAVTGGAGFTRLEASCLGA